MVTSALLLTAHEKSILTWLKNKPVLKHCQYKWDWQMDAFSYPTGITLDKEMDPTVLVAISDELMTVKNWFLDKPQLEQDNED